MTNNPEITDELDVIIGKEDFPLYLTKIWWTLVKNKKCVTGAGGGKAQGMLIQLQKGFETLGVKTKKEWSYKYGGEPKREGFAIKLAVQLEVNE